MLPDPTDTATLVFKYVVYVINIGQYIRTSTSHTNNASSTNSISTSTSTGSVSSTNSIYLLPTSDMSFVHNQPTNTSGLCIMRQLDMHKTVKGTFAGTPTFPIVFPEGHPDFKGEQKTDGKKSN